MIVSAGLLQAIYVDARARAENRPCGDRPCDSEFPEMPWRWCDHCLIAHLLPDQEIKREQAKLVV